MLIFFVIQPLLLSMGKEVNTKDEQEQTALNFYNINFHKLPSEFDMSFEWAKRNITSNDQKKQDHVITILRNLSYGVHNPYLHPVAMHVLATYFYQYPDHKQEAIGLLFCAAQNFSYPPAQFDLGKHFITNNNRQEGEALIALAARDVDLWYAKPVSGELKKRVFKYAPAVEYMQ